MKISVVVPVYNAEKSLNYCIQSIINQTYVDFEVLLIDDGSTDMSGCICDKYASENKNITAVHIENGGVSKARNIGIDLAKGEYICFVDSDDYISIEYLNELVKTKNQYNIYDNIWCGFYTSSDYNQTDLKIYLADDNTSFSFFERNEIMILQNKWLSQMPWNKLFSVKIIKDNNIRFPENLSLGEDLLFNLKYLDCTNGQIVVINKPLNFYVRSGNESLDNKYYPNLLEIYDRINDNLFNYLRKWDCDSAQLVMFYNSCFFGYEKVMRNTFHKKSITQNKYRFNRRIMKSKKFKMAYNNSDCYIHPLYRVGYKIVSYRYIRFLEKIFKMLKKE